jgi:hypothetical protein
MGSHLTTNAASPRVAPRSARRDQTRASARGRNSLRQEVHGTDAVRHPHGERLARALGWFSLGLGLAEVVAPQGVARLVGLEDDERNHRLLRGRGMREIASGLTILSQRRPAPGVWSRVAGDAIDLALLTSALRSETAQRGRVVAATAAVLGVTAVDIYCGTRLHHTALATRRRPRVPTASVAVSVL